MGTIIGTVINAFITNKVTKSNQDFQLEMEHQKHQRAQIEKKLISKISREFSLTGINIKREAQITAEQYDATYSEICTSCDLISAYCDLFFPDLSRDMNQIYGEMNMFWGTFKSYLYFLETQVDHKLQQSKMNELVIIANKINEHIRTAKYRLSSIMEKME